MHVCICSLLVGVTGAGNRGATMLVAAPVSAGGDECANGLRGCAPHGGGACRAGAGSEVGTVEDVSELGYGTRTGLTQGIARRPGPGNLAGPGSGPLGPGIKSALGRPERVIIAPVGA